MIFLNQSQIKTQLQNQGLITPFDIHVIPSIDSTNCFLKALPFNNKLTICCAEQQTKGRGRFGRQWHSPFGEHIYCSSLWPIDCDLSKLSGLSLVCGLALIATLREFINPISDLKIKWPNDVLWKDKKLGGILIELITPAKQNQAIIIGIGLNVNPSTDMEESWASLYDIKQKYTNRNLIIAKLLINLEYYLHKLIQHQFSAFISEWQTYDYLEGKYITLTQSASKLSGTVQGIDSLGQLILLNNKGMLQHFSSGNTSLHKD